jgi:hypothetical protein
MPDLSQSVVVLAEPDYRFGTGPLILRIRQIDRTSAIRYDGEDWITVYGTEVRRDGTELGERVVLVRAARLPTQVLPRSSHGGGTAPRR